MAAGALGRRRFIAVVVAQPGHGPGQVRLVAAFRREIEQVVSADQDIEPARVSRIGMEHIAARILVEDARARHLIAADFLPFAISSFENDT